MTDDPRPAPALPGAPVGLRVRVERHRSSSGDVDVLCLTGDLDAEGVAELRAALPAGLADLLPAARDAAAGAAAHGGRLVVAELAGVAFMDSSGTGGLISLHRRLEEAGGRFAVCCVQPQPRYVLEITAADRILSVHPTLAEALRRTPPVAPAA